MYRYTNAVYVHVYMYHYTNTACAHVCIHVQMLYAMCGCYRVSLESEMSQTSRLRGEQQATQDAVGQLEAEMEGLQTLLTSVTSELEEARSHLAEYQQTEDSLERSARTISSLHQVSLTSGS